ncbi:MAG: FUSC family protein, partial [Oscillibacter sp.]|nr:FUSC family protein [Oscillibacter sp.]
TSSRLIFAMLGAMAAVQPTFKESVESCLTQILGVLLGGLAGVFLLQLPIHPHVAAGIGVVLVITFYNACHIRFSPSLPCFIVVLLCTTPDILPISYALGRFWDSTIGLGVGMVINTLVFPYDNSRRIRSSAESLDRALIVFLEELFDGDLVLPDAADMSKTIDDMEKQLRIFANQKLILHLRRQRRQLEQFRLCEGKARQLVAHMEVLSHMDRPGRLNDENRRRLAACGASIADRRPLDSVTEKDIVTNYHVSQILTLQRELLETLRTRDA